MVEWWGGEKLGEGEFGPHLGGSTTAWCLGVGFFEGVLLVKGSRPAVSGKEK